MKFNALEEMDKYSPEQAGMFTLKNDGDTARVRVLYESINDVDGSCVHKIRTRSGQYIYVDCLRTYEDPLEMCPLCNCSNDEYKKTMTKIWVPLYDVDNKKTMLWERGKMFWKDVLYPLMVEKGTPFCGHVFTIERHGEAKSMDTTYEFIEDSVDDTILEDFESIPKADDSIVKVKTFEELENFVRTGAFDGSEEAPDIPVRRRGSSDSSDIPTRRGVSRPNIV